MAAAAAAGLPAALTPGAAPRSRGGALRGPGSIPASSESTSASQLASITFSCTPIAPHVSMAVGGVEQHARDRAGRLPLVEDADLVVDELDVAQVRIGLGDRLAQRGVQRVDGAVALGGADVALAVDPDLDRGLGLDLAVLALLGHHAPRLELEERLVLAGLAPDQEVEGAVGGLELEAAVLELLDALDHPRGGRVVDLRARSARPARAPSRGRRARRSAPRASCRPRPGRCARTSRGRR